MSPRRKVLTFSITWAAAISAGWYGLARGADIVDQRYVHADTFVAHRVAMTQLRSRDSLLADLRFRAMMDTLRTMTHDLTSCIKHRDLCP